MPENRNCYLYELEIRTLQIQLCLLHIPLNLK